VTRPKWYGSLGLTPAIGDSYEEFTFGWDDISTLWRERLHFRFGPYGLLCGSAEADSGNWRRILNGTFVLTEWARFFMM
jgi:hypothetical protein